MNNGCLREPASASPTTNELSLERPELELAHFTLGFNRMEDRR
jgi:hypothetical protein